MIKLRDITKYYSTGYVKTFVLRNITLDFAEGEFVTIMGPSGAGKSTLLHILGMLDSPSEGEYFFYGQAVHRMTEKQLTELHKHHIGFVFQSYHLIDDLTVYENLETPLLYKKIKTAERKGLVADALDRFAIVGKKDLFPNPLSGGQQQRVAIARALANDPPILAADEPTGNLDSVTAEAVFGLFENLVRQGKTIVMVTHDDDLAARVTRALHVRDGEIVHDARRPLADSGDA